MVQWLKYECEGFKFKNRLVPPGSVLKPQILIRVSQTLNLENYTSQCKLNADRKGVHPKKKEKGVPLLGIESGSPG